jgi:glutathione S-transferase
MGVVYHIAYPAEWDEAKTAGEYRMSTRGRTMDEEGFIHASGAFQVAPVADRFYADEEGPLVVLVVDVDRLAAEVRYEAVPGSEAPFPHIYGPINPDAVIRVLPLERGGDGKYRFTAA